MSEKWFIADLHLNHEFMCDIQPEIGTSYRPEFKTVEEMNETIINNINRVVGPKDKLYLLGDVAFKPSQSEELIKSIQGRKTLVMGNHDQIRDKTKYYTKIYHEICVWKKFREHGFICTHIPLRVDGIRDCFLNLHGHIHRAQLPEPCYMNISAENVNYTPVHFDVVCERAKDVARMVLSGEWCPPTAIAH